jgi:hypothetical protein
MPVVVVGNGPLRSVNHALYRPLVSASKKKPMERKCASFTMNA